MNDDQVISQLSALAQATRFGVFKLLIRQGEAGMPAGAIAEALGVPQNTLSTHLNILSNAGLVSSRREGRSLIYSVAINETRSFLNYLVNDCCEGHPELCDLSVESTKPC
ncbi:ArsR/SmtB family transcription factor [Kordiimonas aestuarii]|uniref:ArsR/SmtB family transcription factor n=1 Tax=Kordiimonas aestuarii TaxID=1005925 RepID=UPI0021D0866F|nr:metalloregulator ArsR/SmtB family transcription factor [Kordiimonas aestuarii]